MEEIKTPEKPKRIKPPVPPLETLRLAELLPPAHYIHIDPAFSLPSLRWHLFHRHQNGLVETGAVVEIGRRVLIDPARFRAWVRAGGSASEPEQKVRKARRTPRGRNHKAQQRLDHSSDPAKGVRQ
jgi:hypothetical protein